MSSYTPPIVHLPAAAYELLQRQLAEAIRQRDEARAALRELIRALKCAMNAIAISETCVIRFMAALKEAGIEDGFCARAEKAAGLDA